MSSICGIVQAEASLQRAYNAMKYHRTFTFRTLFVSLEVEWKHLRLYLVWCIQELNPHINLTSSRLEMPLEIRELKSDQVPGKGGGTSTLAISFTKGGTCSLKRLGPVSEFADQVHPKSFYNGKKPEIRTVCFPKDTS